MGVTLGREMGILDRKPHEMERDHGVNFHAKRSPSLSLVGLADGLNNMQAILF
jgi:hypothetical protein